MADIGIIATLFAILAIVLTLVISLKKTLDADRGACGRQLGDSHRHARVRLAEAMAGMRNSPLACTSISLGVNFGKSTMRFDSDGNLLCFFLHWLNLLLGSERNRFQRKE